MICWEGEGDPSRCAGLGGEERTDGLGEGREGEGAEGMEGGRKGGLTGGLDGRKGGEEERKGEVRGDGALTSRIVV